METKKLEEIEKIIDKKISKKTFYEYDFKDEIFLDYEKLNDNSVMKKSLTDYEKLRLNEIRFYDKFVDKIDNAKSRCNNLFEYYNSNDEYANFIKYLLFKYQNSVEDWYNYYDCDTSYPVYLFYKKILEKNPELDYKILFDHGVPRFFDTYFSVQSIWGELLNNFYKNGDFKDYKGYYIGNDFKWQIENFDKIKNFFESNIELKELFESLNKFVHYYHTIGNMAPCPKGINKPKGNKKNKCYDRIDLFLSKTKSVHKNDWQNWYYLNYSKKELSEISKVFCLKNFLNPNLGEIKIPRSKDDIESIKYLTRYINIIIDNIKKRGKELTK